MVKGKQHEKGDILQKATLSSSLPLNSCCCASSYHLLFCCGLHLFFYFILTCGGGDILDIFFIINAFQNKSVLVTVPEIHGFVLQAAFH